MAKKRSVDPGLQYLQEIGFDRIRGKYGLADRWIKVFGKEKMEQLFKQREKIGDGTTEFYEFKNSDQELSKSFSEAYDGDIIRKACNYISNHKEYFGDTILEVGCESGYMTGFLAKTFPDAKIVSIDRSQAAIDMAMRRLESLGSSNVEFRVMQLNEVHEQFDTVFCMRTIQENLDYDEAPFVGEPIVSQFFQYAALTDEYTDLLIGCLKDDGYLCAFERVGHDPLMCGWMVKLCLSNCAPIMDTYTEVKCEEVGDTNTFQAFICRKGSSGNTQEMIHLWYGAIEVDPSGRGTLTGWNALSYLNDNAGKLIRGVRIFNNNKEQVGRFAVFYDKDNEPLIYYLNAAGGSEVQLYSYDKSLENDILKHLQEVVDLNTKSGLNAQEIDPEEEFLEGV